MKRSWKKMTGLFMAAALGVSLMGFTSEAKSTEGAADAAESLNETKEMVLGSVRDMIPGEGDAFYVNLSAQVWEPLVINNNHKLEPGLAESWETNDDCTEWTFHLVENASFTDGVKFDADACMKNIERYKAGPLTSTYTSLSIDKSFPNLKEMVKIDDYTVKFVFSEPITTLDALLGDYGSPMISPNCFDASTGEITSQVVGTGRYIIDEHVQDQYATFVRNEDYWGENPGKLKSYRVNCIPDSETRYSALVSGEIMGLMDNGAIMVDAADKLVKSDDRFVIEPTKSHMTHYLYVNGSKEYLGDVRLRQAISYAIDREQLNETLYAGLCYPAYGALSNQTPLYKDIQGEYNLEKAKELADEVLGGQRLQTTMILGQRVVDGYPVKAMAEYMQAALSEIGIDMTIEVLDNAVTTDRLKAGDYDFNITVTGLNSADPYATLFGWMGTEGGSNVSYHWNYSNPEVDELLSTVLNEKDEQKRAEIYGRLQEISAEELPVIPILYYVNVNIHNKEVTGYVSDLFDGVSIPTLEWADESK
ncbi:ABC transporter substrate-binding protein [Murimonas intestini]|uniref:ABC transporter substrate-binding protein n=1 Tax=Murimonas intestini TaxID=1337051 RepID=UPI0011DCAB14|nr:ABC transporter substrate-binding protein [Murimonas intestini]